MYFYLNRGAFAAVVVLAVLLSACSAGDGPKADSAKSSGSRKPAPEFALRDADGKTVRLSDYRGKVVLLNFWATWCGPCRMEIPWFVEFERRHKSDGFAVLGVALDDEGWDVVKPFASELKINYRLLMGDEKIADQYGGVDSLPTTFLIDRDGNIAQVHIGLVSKSVYENDLKKLLGGSSQAFDSGVGSPAVLARAD